MKKIEIYDTTLRDGSQLEGISLTVEDKLRIAEQLDWLGVDYIEAGWPGANPKDDELFRRTPEELKLTTSTLVAFGSTRRVKGKVDSDDTLRHLVEANVGTVCIVGKSWDYHVTEALGTTLDEGVAMVGGLRRVPARRGHAGALRRRALLRRLRAQSRVRVARPRGGGDEGREPSRAVRHQRWRAAASGRGGGPGRRAVLRRRRHGRGTPPRRRGNRCCERARRRTWWRDPGAGHDQRVRRTDGQLQPHDDHPEPHAEDGVRDDSRRPARAAHARRAPRGRAGQHAAQPAGRVRRALRVRAQGGPAHERDRQAARRVRARPARRRRQRHAFRRVGAGGEVDARPEGEGARTRSRRSAARGRRRDAEAARARGLPLRGRRRFAGAADAARESVGSPSGSRSSRSASSPTTTPASTR